METYLAISLTGARLLIGEVDSHGNILKYKKYNSGFFSQQASVGIITSSLDDYIANVGFTNGKPLAMGVGLIGRVDTKNGIWLQIDLNRTLPIELAKILSEKYGMPCRIDNDVKSATRAERVWGIGQYSNDFVYINVGSGIAVGIVINGRQVRGSHFNAGEAGHTAVGTKVGLRCSCGRMDCVELLASASGIDRCARALAGKYKTELEIPSEEGKRIDINQVAELSQKGDELCSVLIENASDAISDLIMNLVRISDPDTVVLGGSVVANPYIYDKILSHLKHNTMRFVSNGVVITKLNPQFIGLIGAAAVAMDK